MHAGGRADLQAGRVRPVGAEMSTRPALAPGLSPIRQWCEPCQQYTRSVLISGHAYCARCEPDGPADCDDED